MGLKLAAAAVAAVAATTLMTTSAHASEPKPVDWMRLLVQADHYVRTGTELGTVPPPANQTPRPTISDEPSPQNLGNAWFGVAPRASLAFRDWRVSTRLAGEQLSLVDAMRLSASTRMLVGRARLSTTRFTPFLQVGIGQWRTDSNYLPLTPHMMEIAGQLGTGFEVRLGRRWQIAAETSVTELVRQQRDLTSTMPKMVLWSGLLASRIEF